MALCTKAGELLLGFFYFYANEFDWENHVVSLNRKGITTKQMLGWDAEETDALHSNNFLSRVPILPGSATWQNRSSISENDHEHDHEDNHHDGNDLEMNMTGENNSNEHDAQDEQIRTTNNNNTNSNKRISNFSSGIGNSNNNNNNNIGQLGINDLLIGSSAGLPRRHNTVRYSFCIEDPYEENLNLGRHMGISKSLRVQGEFCRGLLSLLKDDLHSSCVFASSDANERDRAAHTMRSSPSSLDHNESSPALDESSREKEENDKSNWSNAEMTHTMNEAAAALLTSGSVTASSSTITAVSLDNTPLPLKVVWKLMAVCTSEMVEARRLATCPSKNSNKFTKDSDANKDTQTTTTTTSIGASNSNQSKVLMSSESIKTLQENEKVHKEDTSNTSESNAVDTSNNKDSTINSSEAIPTCSDPDAISSVALEMAFMKYAPLEYKLARRV